MVRVDTAMLGSVELIFSNFIANPVQLKSVPRFRYAIVAVGLDKLAVDSDFVGTFGRGQGFEQAITPVEQVTGNDSPLFVGPGILNYRC
jgi:hypothetical protein